MSGFPQPPDSIGPGATITASQVISGVLAPGRIPSVFTSASATEAGWQAAIDAAVAAGGGTVILTPNDDPFGLELTVGLTVTADVPLYISAYGCIVRPPLAAGGYAFKVETGEVGYLAKRSTIAGLVIRRLDYVAEAGGDGIWFKNSNGWQAVDCYMFGGRRAWRITNDGVDGSAVPFHAENHLFKHCFVVGAQYGAYLETINGGGKSFDSTFFEDCGFSACFVNDAYWGANVRMDRGGFVRCTSFPLGGGTSQQCMFIDGELDWSTIEMAFDATSACTTPVGLYFGPNAKNLIRNTRCEMSFLSTAAVWTRVQRDAGIGVAESTWTWKEGGYFYTEGATTSQSTRWARDSDAHPRFAVLGRNGELRFGDGAAAPVINLYGGSATNRVLATDAMIRAVGASIRIFSKAGVVGDGDFPNVTPLGDGILGVDITNGRFYIKSNGLWQYLPFSLTPFLEKLADQRLTSGEAPYPLTNVVSVPTLSSGTVRLTYFQAQSATVVGNMLTSEGTIPGVGTTLARVGLYSIAANGDGTLVAGSTTDTAMWTGSANTPYTKAMNNPGPFTLIPGNWYAGAALSVKTAGTDPNVAGLVMTGTTALVAGPFGSGSGHRFCGAITAQADLPASFVAASVVNSSNAIYFQLLT